MQFGWLDLFGERWLLLTGNLKYPVRSWVDKKSALAELREEGWTISGHPSKRRFSKRLSPKDPWVRDGENYPLMRCNFMKRRTPLRATVYWDCASYVAAGTAR